MRKRFSLAAGVATLALLALPSLASANPGTGPELVQRSGRLVVLHGDRRDGSSTQQWMLVNGSSHVPVRAPADVWIDPGTQVRLEGTMQSGKLVLADSVTAVEQEGPSPLAAEDTSPAPAVHNVAVIIANFQTGATNWPVNEPSLAGSVMFNSPNLGTPSVAQYYQEQTYGQIALHGAVVTATAVTLPGSPADACQHPTDAPLYTWLGQAKARVPGFSETAYQHVVLALPTVNVCGLAGVAGEAEVGGNHIWITGDFSVRVLAHEFGHNLGLAHAGGLSCTNNGVAASMGTSCDPNGFEYADPFDAMGAGDGGGGTAVVRQMSMEHKLSLHLVPSTAIKVVGIAGTYRLAPMETLTPGALELLRLPKAGGGNYFVEYRQPIGYFDSNPTPLSGVLIRTESPEVAADPANPNADTALIDMHPATFQDWSDAAMDVGQVFTDPLHGISIQNMGQDATGVTLQITLPRDTLPPSAPSALTAVASGTDAVLHWTAASDDYGVDDYVVSRDGAQVGTPDGTDFTDTGLVPGTKVAYTVSAIDAGGNVGPAAAASLTVPDTSPPGAPPKVTARLTKDGMVHVAWRASTDNGRVAAYRVRRNGTAIATRTTLAYVDKSAKPGSGSTVTYSVVAVDLAGNAGPAGKATPLRAPLLRKLGAARLKIADVTVGVVPLLRVTGTVSDAKAQCRVRAGSGGWHACKPKASGIFAVILPARGSLRVTVSLRDALGRTKLLTLPIP